ncbi:anti-sigma factor family protein [Actinorugispora endophytica]|uniref:Uncharacterized protein n=1 Tax=Actinorugispora endophytica TaxID=1605990 RepID=A0A4R6VEP0_9ACTN|nr:hypothetical protein [Actinorugispora endophytica]TDQ55527.1 hypothetical protein EV190_101858 [Actinorugispora endophytica]
MTSHVDPETLALFAEGLLDEDEEQQVRACLAESEETRAQLSALTEVSQILAAAPVPPMPDGLISRIDEALRAESDQHTAASDDGYAPPPSVDDVADVVPLRRKRGPARWMPYLVAAAAVVFVLGAGAAVLNGLSSSTGGGDTAAQAPQEAAEPDTALSYQLSVVSSGTDYTAADLPGQGASVLERSVVRDGPATPGGDAEEAAPLQEQPFSAEVSSCVGTLSRTYPAQPVLIDLASYEGHPAWIMLYPIAEGTGAGGHELLVVGPDCAEGTDPAAAVIATAVIPSD